MGQGNILNGKLVDLKCLYFSKVMAYFVTSELIEFIRRSNALADLMRCGFTLQLLREKHLLMFS